MPEISRRISNPMRTLLCGAFCVIVLTAMLVRHAWPLMTGEPIYLEVIARDPRDLFRGDYVVLTYPISRLVVRPAGAPSREIGDAAIVEPIGGWWDDTLKLLDSEDFYARQDWLDRTLYVQLRAEPSQAAGVPQVHRPVSVSDEPVAGSVNLKGRLTSLNRAWTGDTALSGDPNQSKPPSDVEMELHFGIDALYVQEGTGPQIEKAIRAEKVHAIVMVTSSGDARLSDLVIDGRLWSSIIAGE